MKNGVARNTAAAYRLFRLASGGHSLNPFVDSRSEKM
jgi:hypothetical protein